MVWRLPAFLAKAAQQVQLVRAGDGDEHIVVLDASLGQGGDGGAVAHHAQHVVGLDDLFHPGLAGVDDGDAVAFLAQLAGKGRADLAAAYQYDLHMKASFLSKTRRAAARKLSVILAHFSAKVYRQPAAVRGHKKSPVRRTGEGHALGQNGR